MKNHCRILLCAILSLPGCSSDEPTKSVQGTPNIILIIADDLGWDVFGDFSGISGQKANTPTLDSLAANGVTFQNFWVNPVCTPTRAALLTGKYAFRTGVGGVQQPFVDDLESSEIILQKYLTTQTNNAYSTALIGKWHVSAGGDLNAPENFGVGFYSGIFVGAVPDFYNWTQTSKGTQTNVTTYTTTHFVNQAIDWIDDQNKPFFLWLAVNAPHSPFHRPPLELITDQSLITTQSVINANPYPYYLAAIEALDTEIARLIASLSKAEKENTVFLFMGDNGTPSQVAQAPYTATKSTLFQGGVNTPLIVCGKNIARKGVVETALVQAPDLFPTIAEIGGLVLPTYQDGTSLRPLCSDASATKRTFVYTEQFGQNSENDGYAIRDTQFKLIRLENGTEYFYDLQSDPFETSNLLNSSLSYEAQAAYNSLKAIKSGL